MILVHGPWTRDSAEPWLVRVTAVVMVVDALLLITHVLHRSALELDPDGSWFFVFRRAALWNGGHDGSLMELFGLLQLGAAAVLFILRGLLWPSHRVLAAWGGILLLLFTDDRFQIHEQVGAHLALDRALPTLGEAAAQELGGLIFWAVSGLVLVGGLVRQHRRSAPAARSESLAVLATVVPFVVVAVGYVLLGPARPGLVHGSSGQVVDLARTTVKLLTMTLLLVPAMRLVTSRP